MPTKALASDALWQKVAPIWAPPRTPKTKRGQPPTDPRILFDLTVEKLRTGNAWQHPSMGRHWTSCHKRFKALVKAGFWPKVWRAILAHGDELGLSWQEKLAATRWQIKLKALPGRPGDYGVSEPAEADESRRGKKRPKQPPKPREKRPPHETIWLVPDELWERAMPRLEAMFPRHPPGFGRRRADFRQVINAAIFFARTGAQWKAMGNLFGLHYSTVHKWLRKWQKSGVLAAIRESLIKEAEAMGLIDFEFQVMDGSYGKSRAGGECVGENPTDRAKGGLKRSVLTEGNGYPLSVIIAPANISDRDLVAETLEKRFRPSTGNPAAAASQTLLLDRGYRGKVTKDAVEAAGYVYRAPPRDDDDPYWLIDTPLTPAEKRIRARVEICHAWMVSFRAVLVRHGYRRWSYEATCELAMILIWWRRVDEAKKAAEKTKESSGEVAGAA